MADAATIEPLLTHRQFVADVRRRIRYCPIVAGHDPRALPPIGPNNLPIPLPANQPIDESADDTQPGTPQPKPSKTMKNKPKSPPIPLLIAFVEKHERMNAEWQALIDLKDNGMMSSLTPQTRGGFIKRWLSGRRAER